MLPPGGFLLISSMVGDPKGPDVDFDPGIRCQLRDGMPYRYMSRPDALVAEVERAGFRVLERRLGVNGWWDHLDLFAVAGG